MRFYEKVNDLCREKGISITSLALELGFSKGTPSNWKTMTKPPRAEKVKKVADYFGVPVSYFSDDFVEPNKTAPEEQMLSEGEETLLTLFRQISPERQELVLAMIRAALQG